MARESFGIGSVRIRPGTVRALELPITRLVTGADVSLPVRVIHGREDKLLPSAGGEATAQAIAGARLELIDGMGHDLPIELWPRFAGLIAENAARAKP